MSMGRVVLVGAGPGHPDLITVRGLSKLQAADIVIHDALLDPRLLDNCPEAEIIDVGKRGGNHPYSQDSINELLYAKAQEGGLIVRLKGGDPFLFGRGAEEAAYLKERGVEVEVVPGVSSSIAVPELCGVPITHRDFASHVTIVTGHERADREKDRLDWKAMATLGGTIVILMGMGNHARIAADLMEGGLAPETPVAVIVNGASDRQESAGCTLGTLSETVLGRGLKAPGIIVIGGCASLLEE